MFGDLFQQTFTLSLALQLGCLFPLRKTLWLSHTSRPQGAAITEAPTESLSQKERDSQKKQYTPRSMSKPKVFLK